jgi:hypothetical protein
MQQEPAMTRQFRNLTKSVSVCVCVCVCACRQQKESTIKLDTWGEILTAILAVDFTASRMSLGLTQPPIHWVPGALTLGVKRPGCEADHSPPSSAEIKECVELYLHSPSTSSWRGAQLKHRDNFTFTRLHNVYRSRALQLYTEGQCVT